MLEELKEAIQNQTALIVCGLGVSIFTNREAPTWRSLIESGLKEAAAKDRGAKRKGGSDWSAGARALLDADDVVSWLAVADLFTRKLGGPDDGRFRQWIKKTVGTLKPVDNTLLEAIASLGCPIATTNYDDLLRKAPNFSGEGPEPILWTEPEKVAEFLQNKRQGILYLHGHWDHPQSLVLGQGSYDRIVNNERAQFLQKLAAHNRTLICIGCGSDGLHDDNIGLLATWFGEEWKSLDHPHFVIVRDGEALNDWPRCFTPISYGDDFKLLPEFLRGLAPARRIASALPNQPIVFSSKLRTIDYVVPRNRCLGRTKEIEVIVSALLGAGTPVSVGGGPGMGKSTLAIEAVYDPRVKAKFQEWRVFVPLERANEPHAILTELASAFGLEAKGADNELIATISVACAARPVLAILDSCETPYTSDAAETERILRLLGQIEGLALIVTALGTPPSFEQKTALDLDRLPPDGAKEAFLAIAGDRLKDDVKLQPLLDALDGHPLSILLLATRAKALSRLDELYKAYVDDRANLLDETNKTEARSASTRASLRSSFKSRGVTGGAKRLFSILAYLPNGMSRALATAILGKAAETGMIALISAGLAFDRKDSRLRALAPLRAAARLDCPARRADLEKMIDHILALAAEGIKIGEPAWPALSKAVSAEAGNFDSVIGLAIERGRPWSDVSVPLLGTVELQRFAGLCSVTTIDAAMEKYGENPDARARLEVRRASIASDRFDHEAAKTSFTIARDLFRTAKLRLGEALSIKGLAQIAMRTADYEEAEQAFRDAGELFRLDNDTAAEADCIVAQAHIALERCRFGDARVGYLKALEMYRSVRREGSEASSLMGLARWALRLSDLPMANENFERAEQLYEKNGHAHGQNNCVQGRGLIALHKMDFDKARPLLERASETALNFGDIVAAANTLQSLGVIAATRDDHPLAEDLYGRARVLFQQIDEKQGEAICVESQAELALMANDIPAARSLYRDALRRYAERKCLWNEAAAYWQLGEIERLDDPTESRRQFDAAMAIRRSAPEDLALPGWEALHAAYRTATPNEATAQRDCARARWEAIGRRDLVSAHIDPGRLTRKT